MSFNRCCLTDPELYALLQEDAPYGDLTVETLVIGDCPAEITFHVRDDMVICGIEEAARLLQLSGAEVRLHAATGQQGVAGTPLLSASGSVDALFTAWKVAQSLVESLSGVSTAARQIVSRAGSAGVACTRKHLPGIKALMVKAVKAGGAVMHRYGLSESIMVTAEHRTFLQATEAERYLTRLQGLQPEKKIVVETDDVESALALVQQGCQVIQLEKLTPVQVARVVAEAHRMQDGWRPVIAAAGGINARNAADYAAAGADLLVTSAPYFTKPRDVQVRFAPL
ncbi:MAG: ModD protein [Chromatiales bacterium]|jgi:molybdenum transport protein